MPYYLVTRRIKKNGKTKEEYLGIEYSENLDNAKKDVAYYYGGYKKGTLVIRKIESKGHVVKRIF